jgi:hypothetical protein
MKNKIVIGIATAALLLVIVAFSGCVEEKTPESTGNSIPPSKTALQPGVYDVSELSNLPMTISLGNDTYLVLTDADKERIHGYFENRGRYLSAFDLEVIFRDKNGKMVNNGVQEIKIQKDEGLVLKRKIPVYVEIPLDFFETWEVRGSSHEYHPKINLLDIGRSHLDQGLKFSTRGEGIATMEHVVELTGTIDVKRSGKDNVTATLVGNIESKSDKKCIVMLSFINSNFSYYKSIGHEGLGHNS